MKMRDRWQGEVQASVYLFVLCHQWLRTDPETPGNHFKGPCEACVVSLINLETKGKKKPWHTWGGVWNRSRCWSEHVWRRNRCASVWEICGEWDLSVQDSQTVCFCSPTPWVHIFLHTPHHFSRMAFPYFESALVFVPTGKIIINRNQNFLLCRRRAIILSLPQTSWLGAHWIQAPAQLDKNKTNEK